MDISIIIVNYNTCKLLQACLTSVYEETENIRFETIVVDNASTDGSREMVVQEFPQVQLIANPLNRGFAGANNTGIGQATGRYFLLLNPDTVILRSAIQETVRFMERHPEAGISGCKLRFPNGTLQRSVRSFPSVWNELCESTFLYLLFPKSKAVGRYHLSYFDYASEMQVDWVCGAYFMIRREVLDTIGLLDERFYMYSEEVDYCYRAKKAGFQVWFVPQAEIIHAWSGATAPSRRSILWSNGSQILFFKKHFRGINLFFLILFKCFGMAIRVFAYVVAGVVIFEKKLLLKAYYTAYACFRLLGDGLELQYKVPHEPSSGEAA